MPHLFDSFDFGLLDSPEFGEDSVREELIAPLLVALGYTASPPYRIIRSRKLEHPYVQFGTVKKGITIIPDYLLEREGQLAWVLDAKAPGENILAGKNVEQAYSYAMHRDIRVPLYALCNGRRLVVFHVSMGEPVMNIQLQDIDSRWPMVLEILGCRSAWSNNMRPGFLPDFGLTLVKAGLTHDTDGRKYFQVFTEIRVAFAAMLEQGMYSVTGLYLEEDCAFMLTFDFGEDVYQKYLAELPLGLRECVRVALARQPFKIALSRQEAPLMTIVGEIGDKTYTNEDETYRPFIAKDFFAESSLSHP